MLEDKVETYENQIMVLRNKLDELDQIIVKTLSDRFIITDQIGTLKKTIEKPVFDSNREQEIIKKLEKLCSEDSNENMTENIVEIYKCIMAQSRKRQGESKIDK